MKLNERDYKVLESLGKWRFLLSNQIEFLCDFPSSRTMYRRLRLLIFNKYIEKSNVLYGVPSLYTLSHKGLILLGLNKRKDRIRIDTIKHNIYVIDTLIYLIKAKVIDKNNMQNVISEKELFREKGFSNRTHQPDFAFKRGNTLYCVEIELSVKSLDKLERNLQYNFVTYDYQIWVVEKRNNKVDRNLKSIIPRYANIHILYLDEILQCK